MKIKYLLILGVISLTVFLIYLSTLDKKIYYLSLGDSLAVGLDDKNQKHGYSAYLADYLKDKDLLETYLNDYSDIDYRTTDIIKNIEDNKKIVINNQTKTLKNALVKADIVTLSIGTNDLINKINYINNYDEMYDYADEMFKDLNKLLKLIRQYCKEDIFLIGLYNPYDREDSKLIEVFSYINEKTKDLCKEYNITYIDTYNLFLNNPNYIPSINNIQPTQEGYKAIFKSLLSEINKKIIK